MQIQVDSEVLRQMAIAMRQFELDAQSLITTEVSALHGECDRLIDRCRQHILEIERRLQLYHAEVSNCKLEIFLCEKQISECEHEISLRKEKIRQLEWEISVCRARIVRLRILISFAKSSNNSEISSLVSNTPEPNISELKQEIANLQSKISSLEIEISKLQREISHLEMEILRLQGQIPQLRAKLSGLKRKISQHEELIPKMKEIINHAQLIQGKLAGVRLNTDACVRGRTHLLHLAGIIDEFQSTPLPTEATFTPYSFVSSSVNEAPIFDQQFPPADNVAPNNNQEPFYCPQHGIPLQVCPYCGEGRSPLDALLDPTNLFRSDEAAERYRQLFRCEYCNGTGRYCPECISQS